MIFTLLACMAQQSIYTSAPEDWRAEVIPFPLSFAPDLDLNGIEELRFAPGMFDAASDNYFSYTFIWWLEGGHTFSEHELQDALLRYYRGLYQAVSKQEHKDTSEFSVTVTTEDHMTGSIHWRDPFVTEEALTLRFEADQWICASQDRTAVFFRVSPQPADHDVWKAMSQQKAGVCAP